MSAVVQPCRQTCVTFVLVNSCEQLEMQMQRAATLEHAINNFNGVLLCAFFVNGIYLISTFTREKRRTKRLLITTTSAPKKLDE